MSDRPIIEVENLGKRYRLGAGQKNERYTALRDVLAEKARSLLPRRRKHDATAADPQEFWALKDVSFSVSPGEVVGIIGRNGAGKSTLLKILSRITDPTEGRVTLRGRVASLLEVGTGFHPELTGRENIFLNGAVLGMQRAEIKAKFDEIVAFAEVERFLDTPVKRYSSGMYVRLAFAVAAHLEPEILIVDEVLAVGDAEFQKKCLGKMESVAKGEGRTVIFVSHNMALLKNFCTVAVLLTKGQVTDINKASAVIENYQLNQANKSQLQIDVRQARRISGYGEKLRVTDIVFNEGEVLRRGQPIHVTIRYEATQKITEAAFGVGFETLDGLRLMTIESDQPGERFDISPGCRRVDAVVDHAWLEPGMYAVSVGARSGQTHTLDYVPNCGSIEILPGEGSIDAGYANKGGVRPPSIWSRS